MLDVLEATNRKLNGETPIIEGISTATNRFADFECDERDKPMLRDAFQTVGQQYEADPPFFPDWKNL
ncbi:Uncharacterised protein [Achromobacter sp. 2789STDY5608615]|uniref:hypothetical protein n=1 Tax=Achromobacter sp. 2789STDY5608615 TaxID=1806492 RepID=UPI0006C401B8|nr:hypothetical protein [Achromobacter sp. 2789STDY5608615]CUJ82022.1 Uncharacterised protein [Achromobacter sp. 2789STDY5608615]